MKSSLVLIVFWILNGTVGYGISSLHSSLISNSFTETHKGSTDKTLFDDKLSNSNVTVSKSATSNHHSHYLHNMLGLAAENVSGTSFPFDEEQLVKSEVLNPDLKQAPTTSKHSQYSRSDNQVNQPTSQMFVIKRNGSKQAVSFDKITKRISNLCEGLNKMFIDPVIVAKEVVRGLFSGVTTSELDNLASETAAYMSTIHPDYAKLASRIAVSNLQKDTMSSFSSVIDKLYHYIDPKSNMQAGFISDKLYAKVMANTDKIDAYINHTRDFEFDYFGFKTLEK